MVKFYRWRSFLSVLVLFDGATYSPSVLLSPVKVHFRRSVLQLPTEGIEFQMCRTALLPLQPRTIRLRYRWQAPAADTAFGLPIVDLRGGAPGGGHCPTALRYVVDQRRDRVGCRVRLNAGGQTAVAHAHPPHQARVKRKWVQGLRPCPPEALFTPGAAAKDRPHARECLLCLFPNFW